MCMVMLNGPSELLVPCPSHRPLGYETLMVLVFQQPQRPQLHFAVVEVLCGGTHIWEVDMIDQFAGFFFCTKLRKEWGMKTFDMAGE